MKKPLVIILIILGVVILGSVAYFSANYEIKTETKETRLESWEVIKNQYLAAEHFLEKRGKKFEIPREMRFFRLLSQRQPENTTIILLGSIDYLSYEQEAQLFDWILQGGRVVLAAEAESETLADLNIYVDDNTEHVTGISDIYHQENKIAKVDFKRNLTITTDDESLKFTRQASLKADKNYTYVAFKHGQGTIHILSNLKIWDNYSIDDQDHAWLLDSITAENVVIVKLKNGEGSGLNKVLKALVDNFLYSMMALGLFIALILWHQGMRSGAIEESVSRDRRTLSEYLKALANFYRQEKGYGSLILTLQQEIHQRMNIRYYAYQTLSEDQKNQQLAELSQMPLANIYLLMSHDIESQKISNLQFIKRVTELQKIRNSL